MRSTKKALTDSKRPAAAKAKGRKQGGGGASAESDKEPQGVVDKAVSYIRQKIIRGQYAPGQRLIEPDLAEQINVSRTALREAFRRLAAEGLLELELYKGASVRLMKKKDVVESFLIRELLEGMAVRLATPVFVRDAKLKKALLACREKMRKSIRDPSGGDTYTLANVEFHQLILDAADSPQLHRLLGQLHFPLYRIIYSRLLAEAARLRSLEDHERIIDAILGNDPASAEREMQVHIRTSAEALLDLPDDYFS